MSVTDALRHDGELGELDLPEGGLSKDLKKSIRVLVIDDDRMLLESCTTVLENEGYSCTTARRPGEVMSLIASRTFDVVLIDLFLQDASGLELLGRIRSKLPDALPIIITGRASVESGIESIRAGAWDYLPKPFSALQLGVLMGRAAYRIHTARALSNRASKAAASSGAGETRLLGVSSALKRAVEAGLRAAPTDASVFITGESGTGKELMARFIHEQSRRSKKPFVAVNCAALPENLLESEMFGYKRGAFTGAHRDKRGLLETAHEGTIFLDEIGDMSPALQTKLLRVIQDGVVRRLGSETEDAVVNVRFISATNREPEEALQDGSLRADLYFRLRVMPINLPPLRERREDIPVLANHFLAKYWRRHRGPGQEAPRFSGAALDYLAGQDWPGNVRELQNFIEHLSVVAEPGSTLEPAHLPVAEAASRFQEVSPRKDIKPFHSAKSESIERFERKYLAQLVAHSAGNMSEAARRAEIDRTTLYRLMYKHGLSRGALTGEN